MAAGRIVSVHSTGPLAASLFSEAIGIACEKGGERDVSIEAFDTLPSTSRYLAELLRHTPDAPLPRLCATDLQSAGVGRRGKSWLAERGNITFSLASRFDRPGVDLMGLSLVTGICLSQVLARFAGVRVALKWPNDLLVGDAKLGGILTELMPTGDADRTAVILGIGINYHQRRYTHHDGLAGISLEQLSNQVPPRAELIGYMAAHVLKGQRVFIEHGWSAFEQAWQSVDYLRHRHIRIRRGESVDHGRAMGVDGSGALLVEQGGVVRSVYSGDVSVRLDD